MLIDVQVALGLDRQVDRRVLGQQREHVVEEADAGGDLAPGRCRRGLRSRLILVSAVFAANLGGAGALAVDDGRSRDSEWAQQPSMLHSSVLQLRPSKRSISASLPTLMRRPSPQRVHSPCIATRMHCVFQLLERWPGPGDPASDPDEVGLAGQNARSPGPCSAVTEAGGASRGSSAGLLVKVGLILEAPPWRRPGSGRRSYRSPSP